MSTSVSLQLAARDLLFADWGETAAFLEVSATYDPQRAELSETLTETDLLVISGPEVETPVENTAHQSNSPRRSFLVRSEDLPPDTAIAGSRVRVSGRTYAVLTTDRAALRQIVVLNAVALD